MVALGAALVVLLAALPLLLLSNGPDQAAPGSTPAGSVTAVSPDTVFEGEWVGEDPTDGSTNTLTVEAGIATYRETGVTACLARFGQLVPGSATGPAVVEGNRLSFVGTLTCDVASGRGIPPAFENVEWVFEHDPETDTLTLTRDPETLFGRAGNQ